MNKSALLAPVLSGLCALLLAACGGRADVYTTTASGDKLFEHVEAELRTTTDAEPTKERMVLHLSLIHI